MDKVAIIANLGVVYWLLEEQRLRLQSAPKKNLTPKRVLRYQCTITSLSEAIEKENTVDVFLSILAESKVTLLGLNQCFRTTKDHKPVIERRQAYEAFKKALYLVLESKKTNA